MRGEGLCVSPVENTSLISELQVLKESHVDVEPHHLTAEGLVAVAVGPDDEHAPCRRIRKKKVGG